MEIVCYFIFYLLILIRICFEIWFSLCNKVFVLFYPCSHMVAHQENAKYPDTIAIVHDDVNKKVSSLNNSFIHKVLCRKFFGYIMTITSSFKIVINILKLVLWIMVSSKVLFLKKITWIGMRNPSLDHSNKNKLSLGDLWSNHVRSYYTWISTKKAKNIRLNYVGRISGSNSFATFCDLEALNHKILK